MASNKIPQIRIDGLADSFEHKQDKFMAKDPLSFTQANSSFLLDRSVYTAQKVDGFYEVSGTGRIYATDTYYKAFASEDWDGSGGSGGGDTQTYTYQRLDSDYFPVEETLFGFDFIPYGSKGVSFLKIDLYRDEELVQSEEKNFEAVTDTNKYSYYLDSFKPKSEYNKFTITFTTHSGGSRRNQNRLFPIVLASVFQNLILNIGSSLKVEDGKLDTSIDINQLPTQENLDLKQNKQDENLSTLDKTVVGAINEINSKKADSDSIPANITTQGNEFNAANQLVKLDSSGKLPALDGSQLKNLPAEQIPTNVVTTDTIQTITGQKVFKNAFVSSDGTATTGNRVAIANNRITLSPNSGNSGTLDSSTLTLRGGINSSGLTLSSASGNVIFGQQNAEMRIHANTIEHYSNSSRIGTILDTGNQSTLDGSNFNLADKLVRLDSSGKLPALDGSQLLNIEKIVQWGTIQGSIEDQTDLKEKLNKIEEAIKVESFSLFDVKITDRMLTGAEAVGWALQGSLVTNTYPDAVAKVKELYEAGEETTYREITCKRSQDGRYIADIAQKEAIEALFTSTGIADFYVLDSLNNQFYLPKSKWFNQLTTDTSLVNNYNEDGLPNLKKDATGSPEISVWSPGNNVEYWQGLIGKYPTTPKYNPNSGGYGQFQELLFDASKYNSKYGNSENVQPPSSNKLLYYRVGTTIINEAQIDVGNVLSELQSKMDKNFSNAEFTSSVKEQLADFMTPDYTAPTVTTINNSTVYQVPFNGWLYLHTANNYIVGKYTIINASYNADMSNSFDIYISKWDGNSNTVEQSGIIYVHKNLYIKNIESGDIVTQILYPPKGESNA